MTHAMNLHDQAAARVLRPAQRATSCGRTSARLIETLLPQLCGRSRAPAPADLRTLFPTPVTDVRLEIGFGGGEQLIARGRAQSAHRLHRRRAVRQRHGQGAGRHRGRGLANIRLHFDDAIHLIDWLPPDALARIDLLYPDPWPKRRHWKRRFVQDEIVAQARAHLAAGRRIPLRHRHCRLRRLDAAAHAARRRIRMDRAMRRRLAPALARLFRHALPGKGDARGTRAVFSDFPEAMSRLRRRVLDVLPDLPEAHDALRGRGREPLEIGEGGVEALAGGALCRSAAPG